MLQENHRWCPFVYVISAIHFHFDPSNGSWRVSLCYSIVTFRAVLLLSSKSLVKKWNVIHMGPKNCIEKNNTRVSISFTAKLLNSWSLNVLELSTEIHQNFWDRQDTRRRYITLTANKPLPCDIKTWGYVLEDCDGASFFMIGLPSLVSFWYLMPIENYNFFLLLLNILNWCHFLWVYGTPPQNMAKVWKTKRQGEQYAYISTQFYIFDHLNHQSCNFVPVSFTFNLRQHMGQGAYTTCRWTSNQYRYAIYQPTDQSIHKSTHVYTYHYTFST